tara:strand:- start:4105 stop:4587 length:483 start_codon:yes stop_codon:yes gene_type:complete
MGHQNYSIVGHGMSEHEARQDAIREDRDENGHQEGYNGGISSSDSTCDKFKVLTKPIVAKRCTVEKAIRKTTGARKWDTVFVIEPQWGFSEGNYNHRKHAVVKTTQGDAITKAKAMALEFNCEFAITIEKRLIGGDSNIASVKPKKATMGKYLFTGSARC